MLVSASFAGKSRRKNNLVTILLQHQTEIPPGTLHNTGQYRPLYLSEWEGWGWGGVGGIQLVAIYNLTASCY